MTLEVLAIAAFRIAGSLPVLRWPLAGALLAIGVDLADLLVRDLLDLGGVPDYQALDKWLDQVYLGCFLVVALRWSGFERSIAVALYAWRLVGFVAFELAGDRALLFLFPNLFEPWFVAVALVHRVRPGMAWTRGRLVAVLAAIAAAKLAQEWALHVGRIFDGFSSLDFLGGLWRWLGGS